MSRPDGAAGTGLALYRKYRSATFAELIGQDHVTRPLAHALDAGRINHAYLFSGPRGCGKTSSARILARSLNCAQGPTSTPCGVCDSCVELAPNGPGSIDVIEIDAASHNGVDDARDLRERAWFAPVRDRFKVYIIDEAHMVTTAAFNALLKLVEEPPEFLVFVFATTEPDKVLQTIRSRTHHYPFRLVAPSVLRAHLEGVCTREGVAVEPTVLPLVVRAGGGSVRDSLSILDQLLAGAGPEGITYTEAVGLLGVTDSALIDAMVDALAAADAAGVYGAVDRVVEAGHDPRRYAADLLDHLRDLLILDAVPTAGESGLLDCPPDVLGHMSDQLTRLGRAALTRYAEIVHQALVDMRGTTSPRLVLELVGARMLLPDARDDAGAVLQRLERLERRQSLGGETGPDGAVSPRTPAPAAPAGPAAPAARPGRPVPAPASVASPAPSPAPSRVPSSGPAVPESVPAPAAVASARPAPAPAQPVAAVPAPAPAAAAGAPAPAVTTPPTASSGPAGGWDTTALRQLWETSIIDAIKARSRRTEALLHDAQIVAVDGNRLTLSLVSAPLARMAAEDSNVAVVRECLTQALGGTWTVEVVAGALGARPAGSGAAAPPRPVAAGPAPDPVAPPPPDDPRDDPDFEPGVPAAAARGPVRDPEAAAVGLLTAELGARPLD